MSEESRETPRRRFGRKRWLIAPLLLAALGWGAYEWVLRSDWLLEQIRERIIAEAERATGAEVEVDGVRFDRSALTVDAENLRARGPDGEAFAEIPLLRLGLSIESLWRRRVYVRSMEIERPTLRLRLNEDGSWNLPERPELPPRAAEEMLSLTTRLFEVRGGTAEVEGRAHRFSARAEGLDLDVERDVDCTSASIAAERLDWQWRDVVAPGAEVEAKGGLCGDELTVESATLRDGGLEAIFSGSAAPLGGDPETLEATATFEASGRVGEWLERLGAPGAEGRLTASGEVRWANGAPTYSGTARVAGARYAAESIRLEDATFEARFTGDARRIAFEPLTAQALGGRFEGRVEVAEPFGARRASAEGQVAGFRLRQAFAVVDVASAPWTAVVDADVRVEGSASDDWTGEAELRLAGIGPGRPVDGAASVAYDAATQRIEIADLDLRTESSRLEVRGEVRADGRSAFAVALDAADFADLEAALRLAGTDLPEQIAFRGGLELEGDAVGRLVSGGLSDLRFDGAVETGALEAVGYGWDSLRASAIVEPGRLRVVDGVLRDGPGRVDFDLAAQLPEGADWEEAQFNANAQASGLALAKALETAGLPELAAGTFSASVRASGTAGEPHLEAELAATEGQLWREPFERMELSVLTAGEKVQIDSLRVRRGETLVTGAGSFGRDSRRLEIRLAGERWSLADAELFKNWEAKPQGFAEFQVDAAGVLSEREGEIFERLEADGRWAIDDLIWNGLSLGPWSGALHDQGEAVMFNLSGSPMEGRVEGEATVRFATAATQGSARFTGVDPHQALLLAGLPSGDFNGEIAGSLAFSGSLLEPLSVSAEGDFEKFEISVDELPGTRRGFQLYNPFPMRWVLERGVFQAEHMRLAGEGTNLEVDGDVPLWAEEGGIELTAEGDFSLSALQSIFPEIEADGMSILDIRVTGDRSDPQINGLVGVRNASVRSTDFPNGLTGLDGEIRFAGREFRIEELTASSGGGRLSVGGLGHFSEGAYDFRFTADAERVRVRFPENLSSLVNGRLTLAGDETQSLLAGEIIVTRVSTNAAVSLGDLLAALREPQRTPPTSSLLQNLQFNVTVSSGPDLDIETALIRDMEAGVELRLVGTWVSPSLLGRIDISSGQMNFHGTRYTLNRGEIAFVNPFRIEPVLDFELETRIRNIDIALILAGPARRLNLAYRSDPPLPFADLVNLVALGRTPTFDPVLSSQQRIQQQSLFQTGANNVFSQAVERPVSPGLQRFFGVSRLKVDPQVGGAEANPTARISTEQQITNEVTLIYTYDVSSSNQQTVRLEYAPDRTWTFVLTRDENGLVGGDILYKTRLR